MKKIVPIVGLLLALLLVVACAPAGNAPEAAAPEPGGSTADVSVVVYASPL